MGENKIVKDIRILNIEDHGVNVLVNYTKIYRDGAKEAFRTHVKDLGRYYRFFTPKPIVSAVCIGKVYLGVIKNDCRILFIVRLEDGSAQLIQVREGAPESLKLLQLSEKDSNPDSIPNEPAKPYPLGKNELPQGSYLVGRDIPAGTYDFFVVYGSGGVFDLCRYDSSGKIVDGTWTSYWVGLKEDHEKRELIHIPCQAGYTIKIKGNVILKVARSQQVCIEL
jgi:hypothetical protein